MANERAPASLSVSLLLTHGRSNRLFLVHQGEHSKAPDTVGLIAGGTELQDPHALGTGLREAAEEAHIDPKYIIFVRGRNAPEPHVAPIIRQYKIHVGLVFDVTYSGPKVPLNGWQIQGDKVDRVELFPWQQVLGLLERPERIYRPEFNEPQLIRWLLMNHGAHPRRTRTIDEWLTAHKETIPGLQSVDHYDRADILSRWEYIPPYMNWLVMKDIFGNPQRTNFARKRSKWQR